MALLRIRPAARRATRLAATTGVLALATGALALTGCGSAAPAPSTQAGGGPASAGDPANPGGAGGAGGATAPPDGATWMTALAGATTSAGARVGAAATLSAVAMPGSHDAGVWTTIGRASRACSDSAALATLYNAAGAGTTTARTVEKWAFTQYAPPASQAAGGARYFDLRALRDPGRGAKGEPQLRTCHTVIGPELGAFFDAAEPTSLVAFAARNPGEVLVVDWQVVLDGATRDGALSPAGIRQYRDYITGTVCRSRALTRADATTLGAADDAAVPGLTLDQVTGTGRNIINVMRPDRLRAIYEGVPDDQRDPGAWCIFDRDATLQSNWDNSDSSSPWRNGFDYAAARTSLFRTQADWLASDRPRAGAFHVTQNIWNVNPDGAKGIFNTLARRGLKDWTEVDLRPFQKSGFIDAYLAPDAPGVAARLGNANILMTDFVGTGPSGAVFEQVARPWISLNCRKFDVAECPWG